MEPLAEPVPKCRALLKGLYTVTQMRVTLREGKPGSESFAVPGFIWKNVPAYDEIALSIAPRYESTPVTTQPVWAFCRNRAFGLGNGMRFVATLYNRMPMSPDKPEGPMQKFEPCKMAHKRSRCTEARKQRFLNKMAFRLGVTPHLLITCLSSRPGLQARLESLM